MNQSMPWPMSVGLQLSSFAATLASSCALWWLPFPVLCFCLSLWELSLALCEAGGFNFPRLNPELLRDGSQWIHSPAFHPLGRYFWSTQLRESPVWLSPSRLWQQPHLNTPFLVFLSSCLTSPIPPVVVPEISSQINYLCSTLSLLRICLFSKSI